MRQSSINLDEIMGARKIKCKIKTQSNSKKETNMCDFCRACCLSKFKINKVDWKVFLSCRCLSKW